MSIVLREGHWEEFSWRTYTNTEYWAQCSQYSDRSPWFGFDQARQAVDCTLEGGNTFYSWGQNNRTLLSYESIYLWLFTGGCVIDGIRDCPRACADRIALWTGQNSTYTLANCMVYPLISLALGKGLLNDSDHLASQYGIRGDADLNLSSSWATINKCTEVYCKDGGNGEQRCEATHDEIYQADWILRDWRPAVHFDLKLCDTVDGSINQDLGGVGMIIAYIIQLCILFSGWLIGGVNNYGVALLSLPYFAVTKSARRAPKGSWASAKDLQHRVRFSAQAAALKASLVEYQKTQSFFILAVSIAALLAVNNETYLQVTSWQQLWNNFSFISTIALGGCYPVVLNLLILRGRERLSIFLLGISACCVAVSAVLWINVKSAVPGNLAHIDLLNDNGIEECGGVDPTRSCLQTDRDYIAGFNTQNWALLFPLIVLVFLVVEAFRIFSASRSKSGGECLNVFEMVESKILEVRVEPAWRKTQAIFALTWQHIQASQLFLTPDQRGRLQTCYEDAVWWMKERASPLTSQRWYRNAKHWTNERASRLVSHPLSRKLIDALESAWSWLCETLEKSWTSIRELEWRNILAASLKALRKLVVLLTELALLVINSLLLAQYATYLGRLADNTWSLGQVISVTIWVPVMVEYIYLLLRGIEGGFEYRLAEPFRVMRGPSPEHKAVDDAAPRADEWDDDGGKALLRSSVELDAFSQTTLRAKHCSVANSERDVSFASTSQADVNGGWRLSSSSMSGDV